ncbi:MAG: alpha/beta hydrolase [Ignavibacteriales bacterium]|nr:alpha/beta hydrolase [Ignavibacteriales bacterium]
MNSDKLKIYFLAGLGFDQRLFENLKITTGEINYLNWLEPETEESLAQYVKRMSGQINIENEKLILVGHSFGGIIVQEISKLIPVEKILLISSIKSENEKPLSLKIFKFFPIYKFFNKN